MNCIERSNVNIITHELNKKTKSRRLKVIGVDNNKSTFCKAHTVFQLDVKIISEEENSKCRGTSLPLPRSLYQNIN